MPTETQARAEHGQVTPRIDRSKYPEALRAMRRLHDHLQASPLDPVLQELVAFRASQINGCAWCLDMHSKELRGHDVPEHKLYLVSAWRESPQFTQRERAALAWTEALTVLGHEGVPDTVYELARRHFSEPELVELTLAVISINGWNRLNIAWRSVPGDYRVRAGATAAGR